MNITTTMRAINRVAELNAMMEALKKEHDALADDIKAFMSETGTHELVTDDGHRAVFSEYEQSRFDTTAFKKDFGADAYAEYSKVTTATKLTVK